MEMGGDNGNVGRNLKGFEHSIFEEKNFFCIFPLAHPFATLYEKIMAHYYKKKIIIGLF